MFSIITVSHGHEKDCLILFDSIIRFFDLDKFELIVIDNLNDSDILDSTLIGISNFNPGFNYKIIKNKIPNLFRLIII